jgi:hypothetical protein
LNSDYKFLSFFGTYNDCFRCSLFKIHYISDTAIRNADSENSSAQGENYRKKSHQYKLKNSKSSSYFYEKFLLVADSYRIVKIYDFLLSSYARAGIFKPLWSPGIDAKASIPPAYVAWRAGTITLFLLGA